MKKPEEIKKGLECANNCSENGMTCRGCPYLGEDCSGLHPDAIEYIEWLEKNLQYTVDAAEVLGAESAKFERERDAAVKDLLNASIYDYALCKTCKKGKNGKCKPICTPRRDYEWRGVCPENTEVQDG